MNGWAVRLFIVTLVTVVGAYIIVQKMNDQLTVVRLNNHSFNATILRSDEERQRGLSNTKSLPPDRAMLFVFPYDTRPGIWMKDMKYPIDILWVNKNYQVVYLVKNAQPDSYPQVFQPNSNARYVIEVPSGTIEKTGIVKGDLVGLPSGI